MQLDVRHLRIVVAIADCGSISRAAVRLGLAQPPVSAQLRRIESKLGGPLFLRGPNGVEPTDLGRFVVANGRALLEQVAAITGSVGVLGNPREPTRPLRISGLVGAPLRQVLDAVSEIHQQAEVFSRQVRTTKALLLLLRSEGTDLVVLADYPDFESALPAEVDSYVLVGAEPVFVAVSAEHPLATAESVGLAELAGDEWVVPASGDNRLHARLRLSCDEAGFTPSLRHQFVDESAAVDLVRGRRVCLPLTPTHTPAGVSLRSLNAPDLRRRIMLAWPPRSPLAQDIGAIAGLYAVSTAMAR